MGKDWADMMSGLTRWPTTMPDLFRKAVSDEAGERDQALSVVSRLYWKPVCAFVRQSGKSKDAAKDLTQEFFLSKVLQGQALRRYDPPTGRFRTYLLAVLKNFLREDWRRDQALKRGGGRPDLSLEDLDASGAPVADPGQDPGQSFMRSWAHERVREATKRTRQRLLDEGRRVDWELFEARRLRPVPVKLAELAGRHGIDEGTVSRRAKSVDAYFQEEIRLLVFPEVSSDEEINDEIRELIGLFRQ